MGRTKGFRALKKAAEEFTNFIPPKVRETIKAHPAQKALYNKTTQVPLPLTYKLQEMPSSGLHGPALGVPSPLPFSVLRTHQGNLPVYTEYKNDRNQKTTVIRRLSGNIDEFKSELTKIVSNYEISEKIGRVEVKGIHTEVVKTWLRRLGF